MIIEKRPSSEGTLEGSGVLFRGRTPRNWMEYRAALEGEDRVEERHKAEVYHYDDGIRQAPDQNVGDKGTSERPAPNRRILL